MSNFVIKTEDTLQEFNLIIKNQDITIKYWITLLDDDFDQELIDKVQIMSNNFLLSGNKELEALKMITDRTIQINLT